MDENRFDVTVDDSIFGGKSPGLFMGLLLCFCVCIQFFAYIILEEKDIISIENDNTVAIFVYVVSILVTVLFSIIREKKTNGVMKISVTMLDDAMEIDAQKKKWVIRYEDIQEIRKQMIISRFYDEKGRYKLKIVRKNRPALIFETTAQEYEKRSDFQDTELYVFYRACKRQGIKCC